MKSIFNKIKSSFTEDKKETKDVDLLDKKDEFKFTYISDKERLENRSNKYQFIIK